MGIRVEKSIAEDLLRNALDDKSASFRPNQWEAIDAVVNKKQKLLVVQKTGWGKSIVYFISAKVFREGNQGPTIVISPLLALMRNQIPAAERLGITAVTINSSNQEEWDEVKERIAEGDVDVLLISPERLSNDEFVRDVLLPISDNLGLLVVDEAHCISDWGHDFRPDYRRIANVLKQMPPNMPILGTTATANNRVVKDVVSQLGDIEVLRGPLIRESLFLQNIRLPDQAARLAWLSEHLPDIPGTGIVYTLTKKDAEQVAEWLNLNGISSAAYYSDVTHAGNPDSSSYRIALESMLLKNEIKVLVATTALGMGYDKPDLGFVIHYQAPGSVVAYYQQVGRAGRAIESARGILLSGREDQDIHEHFRNAAFPGGGQVNQILQALERSDGLSMPELQRRVNLTKGQIEQVLKLLSVENPAPVIREDRKWLRTAVDFEMDQERINFLVQQKTREWKEVQEYIDHEDCLMVFLSNSLDDDADTPCGKCSRCLPDGRMPETFSETLGVKSSLFLRYSEMLLIPRKQVPKDAFQKYGFHRILNRHGLEAETGRILSRWGDAGWGRVVMNGKHANHFGDKLVDAVCEMFEERWNPDPRPTWVTFVPSFNHPALVPDFAKRVAKRLGLSFQNVVTKTARNRPQKQMQNSFYQCQNLDGVFAVDSDIKTEPVLLLDDMVDSRWTLTVIAALLRSAGSGPVYPIVLATTAIGK